VLKDGFFETISGASQHPDGAPPVVFTGGSVFGAFLINGESQSRKRHGVGATVGRSSSEMGSLQGMLLVVGAQLTQTVPHLRLGVLEYGAGVGEEDVGVHFDGGLEEGDPVVLGSEEDGTDDVGVVDVHLAPVCFQVEFINNFGRYYLTVLRASHAATIKRCRRRNWSHLV